LIPEFPLCDVGLDEFSVLVRFINALQKALSLPAVELFVSACYEEHNTVSECHRACDGRLPAVPSAINGKNSQIQSQANRLLRRMSTPRAVELRVVTKRCRFLAEEPPCKAGVTVKNGAKNGNA